MSDRRDSRYTKEGKVFPRVNKDRPPQESFRPQINQEQNQVDRQYNEDQCDEIVTSDFSQPSSKYLGVWGGYHANAIPTSRRLTVTLTDDNGNYIATVHAWEDTFRGEPIVKVITDDIISEEFFDKVIAPIMRDYYEHENIKPMPHVSTIDLSKFEEKPTEDGFFKKLFSKDKKPDEPKQKKSFGDIVLGPDLRK